MAATDRTVKNFLYKRMYEHWHLNRSHSKARRAGAEYHLNEPLSERFLRYLFRSQLLPRLEIVLIHFQKFETKRCG